MHYYLLPIIAVVFGFAFVAIFNPNKKQNLKLLLAFSGAFLLSITVFELLPEVFSSKNKNIGIFIMIGILLQIILEFFSQGAEHGHVHLSKDMPNFPWFLFLSLSIHSILEGFPLHGNIQLLYGIIIHKIPIAIILTSFLLSSNLSNVKTFLFLLLFALMTPIGSFLSVTIPVLNTYYLELSALVVGIFLHISTTILFESNEGHKFNIYKLLVILSGITIAYFM